MVLVKKFAYPPTKKLTTPAVVGDQNSTNTTTGLSVDIRVCGD
jgi:hypothetical protein